MLLRHGQVLAEAWWAPYAADDARCSTRSARASPPPPLGFAVAEGRLDLDDRWSTTSSRPGRIGERTARIRLRHLAAMATGHADTLEPARRADPPTPVGAACRGARVGARLGVRLQQRRAPTPWARWCSRSPARPLTDYLTPRLFDPLGIAPGPWDQHPAGPRRRLHRVPPADRGTSPGSASSTSTAVGGAARRCCPTAGPSSPPSRAHPEPGRSRTPTGSQGYGFQFWHGRHGASAATARSASSACVLPEQDTVLVTTAATQNIQGILNAAWDAPAARGGPARFGRRRRPARRPAGRARGRHRPPRRRGRAGQRRHHGDRVAATDGGWRLGLREGEVSSTCPWAATPGSVRRTRSGRGGAWRSPRAVGWTRRAGSPPTWSWCRPRTGCGSRPGRARARPWSPGDRPAGLRAAARRAGHARPRLGPATSGRARGPDGRRTRLDDVEGPPPGRQVGGGRVGPGLPASGRPG